MKKILLYTLLGSFMTLGATSCNSDDPDKASSKHDYTNDVFPPYLRTNAAATASISIDFPVATLGQAKIVDLKDYATYFHKNLGMTVDEAIDAMAENEVVLYNIQVSRGCWDLTAPNYGATGWAYNKNNAISTDDAAFTIDFDKANHRFILNTVGDLEAGTMANVNLGFAKNNVTDFDDYVRFSISLAVTDPSLVVASGSIAEEDYHFYPVIFEDYEEAIELNLGMTVKEFLKYYDASDSYDDDGNLEGDQLEVYLINSDGEWMTSANSSGAPNGYAANGRPRTTSGWMGWWLDKDLNITSWSPDGYPANFIYLEGGPDDESGTNTGKVCQRIGRAPGVATGTQTTVTFAITPSWDHSKSLTFIVSVSFE